MYRIFFVVYEAKFHISKDEYIFMKAYTVIIICHFRHIYYLIQICTFKIISCYSGIYSTNMRLF